MWGHVNDTERVFLMRALWFARKFDESALPSFDQDIAVGRSQFGRHIRGRGTWKNSVKSASRPFRSSGIFLKKPGGAAASPAGIRLR